MAETITIEDDFGDGVELPKSVAESFVDEFGSDGPEQKSAVGIHVSGYVLSDDGANDSDVRILDLDGSDILINYERFYDQVLAARTPDKVITFIDREGSSVSLDADADFEVEWNLLESTGGNSHRVHYDEDDVRDGVAAAGSQLDFDYSWNFVSVETSATDDD